MLIDARPSVMAESEKDVILVVHEHELIRHSVAEIIAPNWQEMRVLEFATSDEVRAEYGCDGVGALTTHNVALVLFIMSTHRDTSRPDVASVVECFDGVPVVLLSALNEQEAAFDAIRQGARGYLSGLMSVQQVIDALRLVRAGGVYVGPAPPKDAEADLGGIPPDLAMPASQPTRPPADTTALTPRETEVLRHLREGKPNKIIAYELGMSENTVKVHVGRIFKKLGAANRTVVACHLDAPAIAVPSDGKDADKKGPSREDPIESHP